MRDAGSWPSGLKRTKPRASVLSALEHARKPLSAMEICSVIEKSGGSAWLSTKKGIVVKVSVTSSETALYELNRFEHKHYAVCLGCHKIISMDNCPMEKFVPHIEDNDFRVTGHNLEIYGYCGDCSAK